MANELKPITDRIGTVGLTEFAGGYYDGKCIQITPPSSARFYISLTKEQALDLATALLEWVQGRRPELES